jgi:hypothetical protein
MKLIKLRREYHRRIFDEIIRVSNTAKKGVEYPNFADGDNTSSINIAWGIAKIIGHEIGTEVIKGQTSGGRFEEITKDFLQSAFELLNHLRPGEWSYSTHRLISQFNQYSHLFELDKKIRKDKELSLSMGRDYIIKPDIVVGREPMTDDEINKHDFLIEANDNFGRLTPLRKTNYPNPLPILHASISCKWTVRSDRGQNARTEALNLIRNRKGNLPHVVAVTAEPLPTRIASLALGTGDLDAVYHFALFELHKAIKQVNNLDQLDMLEMLIEGKRLRDISDLPFDLAA